MEEATRTLCLFSLLFSTFRSLPFFRNLPSIFIHFRGAALHNRTKSLTPTTTADNRTLHSYRAQRTHRTIDLCCVSQEKRKMLSDIINSQGSCASTSEFKIACWCGNTRIGSRPRKTVSPTLASVVSG